MRRQDKALTDEEMLQIINDEQYGILSTVSADCYPYGIPLNYVYDKQAIICIVRQVGKNLITYKIIAGFPFVLSANRNFCQQRLV